MVRQKFPISFDQKPLLTSQRRRTKDSMGKVLVRGSINIDEFLTVDHIVNSGETIASTSYSKRAGGKGANQAVAAAKAGADVDFAGCIGLDGEWLRHELRGYGVGVGSDLLLLDPKLPTGRAIIQLSATTHDNSIILVAGSNHTSLPHQSLNLKSYSHFLLQNEIPLLATKSILDEAHSHRIVTIFNPSPMLSEREILEFEWSKLSWLMLNEGEAARLLEVLGKEEESGRGLTELEALNGVNTIITKGERGVEASFNGGNIPISAGKVEKVLDTTGAGDCFTGYFASLIAENPPETLDDLGSILKIASQASAICVGSEGAMESVPIMSEVTKVL